MSVDAKLREISEAERKRCGNCDYWMKSSCKPEKEHGQFKSMESHPCGEYGRTNWDIKRIQKLRAELDAREAVDPTAHGDDCDCEACDERRGLVAYADDAGDDDA